MDNGGLEDLVYYLVVLPTIDNYFFWFYRLIEFVRVFETSLGEDFVHV